MSALRRGWRAPLWLRFSFGFVGGGFSHPRFASHLASGGRNRGASAAATKAAAASMMSLGDAVRHACANALRSAASSSAHGRAHTARSAAKDLSVAPLSTELNLSMGDSGLIWTSAD